MHKESDLITIIPKDANKNASQTIPKKKRGRPKKSEAKSAKKAVAK
jgi:hypothetical protein